MVLAEGGPKILKVKIPLGTESTEADFFLAVSLKHWKGRMGGGCIIFLLHLCPIQFCVLCIMLVETRPIWSLARAARRPPDHAPPNPDKQ